MSPQPEPAQPRHLEAALELLRRAQLPEKGVSDQFQRFFVVCDSGRLVGLAGLEVAGGNGLLRSLVVDPQYRSEGVGGVLVEAVLGLAKELGLGSVYLLTTTARDYFLRKGFAECAREAAPAAVRESWEFTTGCPSTSSFLKMALT